MGYMFFFVILFVIQYIKIQPIIHKQQTHRLMIELVRPKLQIPDQHKVTINQYRNPYLSKLTIKILPLYSKINGPTLIHPLQNYNNVAIVQSLPLWRNQKFRIGLIWQQNIRNMFNRSHVGISTQYHTDNNYILKSKNLVGSSFLTTNQAYKSFALSGRLITVSALYSCFFQTSSEYFHTIGVGISFDNRVSLGINKRIGAQTALKVNYQKPLQNDLYLRMKYDTEIQKFDESAIEVGLGYYFSKATSVWLRSAVQSDKLQPNLAVQLQVRKQDNTHCVVSSIQFRNSKSIIYLGYKCPSFNFILPIFGIDSVVPALLGIAAYLYGYFRRSKGEDKKIEHRQNNRTEQLKLISDKANQIYRKQQAHKGLLIQQVYVGQKNILHKFLNEQNRILKLNRDQQYKTLIYDCTISLRFYVQKGQLHIPKGNKLNIIGFYYQRQEGQEIQIYIRYQNKGKNYQKIYKYNQQIKI